MTPALCVGPDITGRSVVIAQGRIVADAPGLTEHLPCPDGRIEPGAVNAHTHLYSGLAAYGLPAPVPTPESFLQILERLWWRLDRALDAPSLHAAAEDYIASALLAGTTTLVDHHESPGLIEGSLAILADACERLGMRAVLCYGATERNGGPAEARRGLDECARMPSTALLRPAVGLHAGFTLSDDSIRAAGDLARRLGTVVHVHVAEDLHDVLDARQRGYRGALERLHALNALPAGSILAHGVHLDARRARDAEAYGYWLVQNPRSNENNRVGYAKGLAASRRVALGTDGWEADMQAEAAALRRLAEKHGDPAAEGRLAAGYQLAAERFGATGTPLSPGALGDLVVRVEGAVRHVVVNGRVVVRDGRLVSADRDAIAAEGRRQAEHLWRRMAAL